MLQRPRGLDHNQENPYAAGPSHHINHKTPARSLKAPPPVTGGKGAVTSTIGRGVLGRKDGNQGKGGGPGKDSALLFPSKPSTSNAGPSQQQSFKTPAPKPRSLRPLADLQTPATALRPKRAPMLMPSPEVEREVEIDVEAEQATKLREMMDLEVEYAGPSATDYEEPYEPECEVTDYKKANYGDALRAMSFNGIETHEEWEARDAIERKEIEFPLEESLKLTSDDDMEDPTQPLFPVPKSTATRRAPLASKSSNNALSSSIRSSAALPPTLKPLTSSASTFRRPALQPSLSAPSTATRRALASSTSRKPAPTSSLSQSTTSTSTTRPLARKPLAASTSTRPTSALSQQSASSVRSRPAALISTARKASSSSIRPVSSIAAAQAEEARRLKERQQLEEEEKKLGPFGLSGGSDLDELMSGMDLGRSGFGFGDDGEDFKLDLDSE